MINLSSFDVINFNRMLFVNLDADNKQNSIRIVKSCDDILISSWVPKNLFIGSEIKNDTDLKRDDFVVDTNRILYKIISGDGTILKIESCYLDGTRLMQKSLFTHKVIASNNPIHFEFGLHKIPESFIDKFVKLQGYSTDLTYAIYERMKKFSCKEIGISFHVDYSNNINKIMMYWEELDIVTKQYLVNNVLGSDDINNIDFSDIMEMIKFLQIKESTDDKSTFEKDNTSAYLDKIPKESLLIFHKLLVEKMSDNQRKLAKNQLND